MSITQQQININAASGVARQAFFFPEQPAIVYGEQDYNYAQLTQSVRSLAGMLLDAGVRENDRVAYLGLNSFSFLEGMLASWWIGAVYVPLNFRLAPGEVSELLQRSAPKVLLVEPTHQDVVDAMTELPQLAQSIRMVMIDEDPQVPLQGSLPGHYARLGELRAVSAGADPGEPVERSETDLAMLMFTSGTTGSPKGVQLTHGNVWWNSVNVDSLVDTRRGDTNLAVAPLFHIGGLNALTIRNLVRGGRTVIRRSFDPRQVLRDIEQYQVNQAFLVPAMLSAMQQTDEFEQHDISSLRALICAGAPVPPVLLKQYEHKGVDVQQAWGLTETAPFATYLPSELTHAKSGSCGVPMPYTEVRIVDPATLEDVAQDGQTGEMWVKGPNVTSGYWKNEEATAAAFRDGWFRSGDIGYRDADGYLYIVDRLKDMIISGGENVYPAEVERALTGFPGLTDIAVVGVPDEKWGERVVAVISCKPGVNPSVEEIRAYAESHLARYKLPKEIVVTEDVPRNGAGKLDKVAIRSLVSTR